MKPGKMCAVMSTVKTALWTCESSLGGNPTIPKVAPDNQNPPSLIQDNQTVLELREVHWTVCEQKPRAMLCSAHLQACWGDTTLIWPATGESPLGS